MDLLNIGTDVNFWIGLVYAVILLALFIKFILVLIEYITNKKWNKYGKVLIWLLIFLLFTLITSLSYGPGKVELYGEDSNEIEKVREIENVDSVREETEKQKPYELKRQKDPGFEEERKQAEEYLKSLENK